MRKVILIIASKIKGKSLIIDESIPLSYIFITGFGMLLSMLRGMLTFGLKLKRGYFLRGLRVKLLCKSKISFGKNVRLGSNVIIDGLSKNGIEVGSNVTIGANSIIKCTGSFSNIGLGIDIGDNFGCGEGCFFGAAGGITIGSDVIMGQSVRFHSQNHNYSNLDILIREQGTTEIGITIGNDCWIGSGAVFLDGVNVGKGCVIGANTLVNKDIPDYSVAVGNPAKVVKKRY